MPKLFQINVVSNVLSTGKICEDIGQVALSNGWESYVAYGRLSKPSASTEYRIGSSYSVYRHYAEHRLFDREGLSSKCATHKLVEYMEEVKPDVILMHNMHDHYLNYPILFRYLATLSTPVVWVQHDCWAFTGGCMYFDMLECDKWKTECVGCPEKRAVFCNLSLKQFNLKKELLANLKSLTFVPVSNWLGELLKHSVQGHRPIKVIHNGVDIHIFRPLPKVLGKEYDFEILGVAADWIPRKGLYELYKLRERLDSSIGITLVGLTQKQIDDLPKGIRGIQKTTSLQALVQLYSDSDVFVNPTFSDNFPTTNIEALACGTPVITYNTGGSPEAIDETTGIVVERDDIEGLVRAVQYIRDGIESNMAFTQEQCRQRVEAHFDKEKCFKKYLNLFDSLLW